MNKNTYPVQCHCADVTISAFTESHAIARKAGVFYVWDEREGRKPTTLRCMRVVFIVDQFCRGDLASYKIPNRLMHGADCSCEF